MKIRFLQIGRIGSKKHIGHSKVLPFNLVGPITAIPQFGYTLGVHIEADYRSRSAKFHRNG
jgi:hypothetical protein